MKNDRPRERRSTRRPAGRPGQPADTVFTNDSSERDQLALKGRLLARVLDTADDAIISIDLNQRIILFNKGAERIFGYEASELLGQRLDILLPAHFVRVHRQHVREFAKSPHEAQRMGERGEIAGRRKSGEEFPAEASISKVDLEGSRIFTVILRDVTERKLAENQIKTSLREKEVLLKEIHHRVKNNLQVVSSLLNLQSRGVRDDETRKLFQESRNRVQSMALIHEQLYESKDLSEVDFPGYIRQLVAYLFRAYGVSSSRVDLKTRIEDVNLNVDAAVPCGLIVNELVSNSLKYAFPDGREGEILIELRQDHDRHMIVTVTDNGVGLPENVDLWNTRTLGLRLVRTLANQLDGQIEVHNQGGTRIQIRIAPAAQTEPE